MLESHPSVKAATGKYWLTHLVYNQFKSVISLLTKWYLWVEDQTGEATAQDLLNRYLGRDTVTMTLCVWVFGIQPKKTYHFRDIALVPVDEMQDARERDEYLALIRNHESPVAYAAFTTEVEVPRVADDETEAHR